MKKMQAKSRKSGSETPAQRSQRLQRTLSEASNLNETPSEYLFSNIDDDNQIDQVASTGKIKIQHSLNINDNHLLETKFLGDSVNMFNTNKQSK